MYTHYLAICDEHGEGKEIFVDTPSRTAHMLADRDKDIYAFMMKHYGCKLRLIHNDEDLDKLWEEGYMVDYNTHEYVRV